MTMDDSDILESAIHEVLDNQIKNGDPPETKDTLDRLMASGHDESAARKLIAEVLVHEFHSMLESRTPYNNARYTAALAQLK